MVLVAVDDLLFSSKIRAAAKQAGVALTFARTPEDIITQARRINPALVILDLDSARIDPVATIGALKQDAGLGSIPTIGFVSHVHTQVISAAKAAGADEVMARSTFAARLPEILASAAPERS